MHHLFGDIRIKRGNLADLPDLAIGEPAFAEDTLGLYMGTPIGNVQVPVPPLPASLQSLAELTIAAGTLVVGAGVNDFAAIAMPSNSFLGRLSAGPLAPQPLSDFGAALLGCETDDDVKDLINAGVLPWLVLPDGTLIDIAAGDWHATHTTGVVTISAGELRIATPGTHASSVPTLGNVATFTNKRVTQRTASVASSATPTINTDNVDLYAITALATAITSLTTNLSGTPAEGDEFRLDITDDGTPRAITYGSKFEHSDTLTLPPSTIAGVKLSVRYRWNTATNKWRPIKIDGAIDASTTSRAVFDGDSLTAGYLITTPYPDLTSTTVTFTKTNIAVIGQTAVDAIARIKQFALPLFRPAAARNIYVLMIGTNDNIGSGSTAQTILERVSILCNYARRQGFFVYICEMMSVVGGDTVKSNYNALLIAQWPTFANALVQLSPLLTASGQYANATYFNGDGIHLTNTGNALLAANVSAAINADANQRGASLASFSAGKNGTNQTGIGASTLTKVTFTTELFDVGNYYDAANSKWTPPAGVCLIGGQLLYTAGMVIGSRAVIVVYKNGSLYKYSEATANVTTGPFGAFIQLIENTNGTDFWEIYAYADGAGNKTVGGTGGQTFFQGSML